MRSCLYRCRVMHHRLEPLRHRFVYDLFMFALDLDEIDDLAGRLKWLSHNRFSLFNFRDKDHLHVPGKTVRDGVVKFLREKGITEEPGRMVLVTHLNTWGYTFNPVSFYFVYAVNGAPLCAVAEVNNTFGEKKAFLLGPDHLSHGTFLRQTTKFFYVSPFINMDTDFRFHLTVPDEKLRIRINDYENGRLFFLSSLTGDRVPLTDSRLLFYSLRFPFITLRIIGLIHWQAFKLWLRGLPYHKKTHQPELQKEVYHG